MPSQKHNFKVGDDVYIPDLFARHKFRVPDDEQYVVDKLIDNERLQVSIEDRSFVGHYSHFAVVKQKDG